MSSLYLKYPSPPEVATITCVPCSHRYNFDLLYCSAKTDRCLSVTEQPQAW